MHNGDQLTQVDSDAATQTSYLLPGLLETSEAGRRKFFEYGV